MFVTMMSFLRVFAGAALSALSFAPPAVACTCKGPATPAQAIAGSAAVFVGQVVRLQPDPQAAIWGPGTVRITFFVARSWKGAAKDTISVLSGSGGGDCSFPYGFFTVGGRYLVYASAAGTHRLAATICSRTASLGQDREDLDALGAAAYRRGQGARSP